MDNSVEENIQKYADQLTALITEVDELAQVVLKGHLVIEVAFDSIIGVMMFNPGYLSTARLEFFQKLQIVRGFALRKDEASIWEIMLVINELRNKLSHTLDVSQREKKMRRLRMLFLAELQSPLTDTFNLMPDHTVAAGACAMCIGYLGTFEHDIRGLRAMIDLISGVPVQRAAKSPTD